MEVRSGFPFNYDANKASLNSGLKCQDKSLTLQSQKEDADINVIVKRFGVTGMLPQVAMPPSFSDFDAVFDYRTAMDTIVAADRSFAGLDASVRKRFGNDPANFLEFCSDPSNIDELRKMGLAVPEVVVKEVEPTRVIVVDKK